MQRRANGLHPDDVALPLPVRSCVQCAANAVPPTHTQVQQAWPPAGAIKSVEQGEDYLRRSGSFEDTLSFGQTLGRDHSVQPQVNTTMDEHSHPRTRMDTDGKARQGTLARIGTDP